QTGAFMAASGGGVDLSELVENGRDLVRRNADTGILDADGDGQLAVADLPADIDENVAALGELHRVANQVGGDLAEAPDIADDAEWQVRIDPDDQFEVLLRDARGNEGRHVLDRLGEIERRVV